VRLLLHDRWDEAEGDAVERGEIVEMSDAGWLVRYDRGDPRWALVTDSGRVVVGSEQEIRRLA
jgi:hypothetical protein